MTAGNMKFFWSTGWVLAVAFVCAVAGGLMAQVLDTDYVSSRISLFQMLQNDVFQSLLPFSPSNLPDFDFFSNSSDTAQLIPSHVPILVQIGPTRFRLQVGHEMLFFPEDVNSLDIVHVINSTYVRDENGKVVFYQDYNSSFDTVASVFEFNVSNCTSLIPYAYCNQHGLWVGEQITAIDERTWENALLTSADECLSSSSSTLVIGNDRSVRFSLADSSENEIEIVGDDDFANVEFIKMEFSFPVSTFLGIGFGTAMANSDMIICGENNGEVCCEDFWVSSNRQGGPIRDVELVDGIKGTNDIRRIKPEEVSSQGGIAKATVYRKRQGSDISNNRDVAVDVTRNIDLIYAFNDIPSSSAQCNQGRGVRDFVQYHGINRFVVPQFDILSGNNCTGSILQSEERDLQVMHGVINFCVWGINLSLGAAVARYARHTSWWLSLHKNVQAVNTLLVFPGYIIAQQFGAGAIREPIANAHRAMGMFLIITVVLQALLGTFMYYTWKVSKKLYHGAKASEILPEKIREHYAELLQKKETYFHNHHEYYNSLSHDEQIHLDTFMVCNLKAISGISSERLLWLLYWVLTWVQVSIVRVVHRTVGRSLIVIAYVQMYFGISVLEVSDVIKHYLYAWTAIVGFIILFKEMELQLGMPRTTMGKIKWIQEKCRCYCCYWWPGTAKEANSSKATANQSYDAVEGKPSVSHTSRSGKRETSGVEDNPQVVIAGSEEDNASTHSVDVNSNLGENQKSDLTQT